MVEDDAAQLPTRVPGRQAAGPAHPAELTDASEIFKTSDDVLEHYARHGKSSVYKFINCNR